MMERTPKNLMSAVPKYEQRKHARVRRRLPAFLVAMLTAVLLAASFVPSALANARQEILTRYDDDATKALQAEYNAAKKEEEKLLKENPTAGYFADEKVANSLADARFQAIQNAPEPENAGERADELRKKADSLDALQRWADDAGVNIDSDVYFGGAESKAEELRGEAEELAARAVEEEAPQDEEVPEKEPEEAETKGAAPPSEAGDDGPVEDQRAAGTVPPVEAVPGFLTNVNPVPLLAFVVLVVGGIYARSRGAGVSISRFLGPAMAEAPKRRQSTKKRPQKKTVPKAPTPDTANVAPPERAFEERDEPPPGSADSAAVREWFESEAPNREAPEQSSPTAEELKRLFDLQAREPNTGRDDELPDDEEPPD